MLAASIGGCSLANAPGDGAAIVFGHPEFRDASTVLPDDGEGLAGQECMAIGAFRAQVAPLLVNDCVKCHDGAKRLATSAFDLSLLVDPRAAAERIVCSNVLLNADLVEPRASPLLLLVDPADRTTDHEFRYGDGAAFANYQTAVVRWLEMEVWPM